MLSIRQPSMSSVSSPVREARGGEVRDGGAGDGEAAQRRELRERRDVRKALVEAQAELLERAQAAQRGDVREVVLHEVQRAQRDGGGELGDVREAAAGELEVRERGDGADAGEGQALVVGEQQRFERGEALYPGEVREAEAGGVHLRGVGREADAPERDGVERFVRGDGGVRERFGERVDAGAGDGGVALDGEALERAQRG